MTRVRADALRCPRFRKGGEPFTDRNPSTSRRCARPRDGARRAHRRSEADEWWLPVARCQRKTRVRIPNGIRAVVGLDLTFPIRSVAVRC